MQHEALLKPSLRHETGWDTEVDNGSWHVCCVCVHVSVCGCLHVCVCVCICACARLCKAVFAQYLYMYECCIYRGLCVP